MVRQVKAYQLLEGARGRPPRGHRGHRGVPGPRGPARGRLRPHRRIGHQPADRRGRDGRQHRRRRPHPPGVIRSTILEHGMNRNEVEKRVVKVVCHVLGVEPDIVTLESHFVFDLGAESTQSVELVAALRARVRHRDGRRRRTGGADRRRGGRFYRQESAIATHILTNRRYVCGNHHQSLR